MLPRSKLLRHMLLLHMNAAAVSPAERHSGMLCGNPACSALSLRFTRFRAANPRYGTCCRHVDTCLTLKHHLLPPHHCRPHPLRSATREILGVCRVQAMPALIPPPPPLPPPPPPPPPAVSTAACQCWTRAQLADRQYTGWNRCSYSCAMLHKPRPLPVRPTPLAIGLRVHLAGSGTRNRMRRIARA
jgi:hypothetical protein